jgi:hypothetical protein
LTRDERERFNAFISKLKNEEDYSAFLTLTEQLNELLNEISRRLRAASL